MRCEDRSSTKEKKLAYLIDLDFTALGRASFEFDSTPPDMPLLGFSAGLRIDPDDMPKSAHQKTRKQKRIDDIFTMPALNAVSTRFKEIVEAFEPNTHQFFPLQLFRKDGTEIEGEFFIFNCTVSVDTVLITRSEIDWVGLTKGRPTNSRGRYGKIVHSLPAMAGRQIWRPKLVTGFKGVFVSDALHAELKKQKLNHYRLTPVGFLFECNSRY